MATRVKRGVSRIQAACYYTVCSVILFILLCILLSVIFTVVKEYNRAKGFKETRCQLLGENNEGIEDLGDVPCTYCGIGWSCKKSSFPCYEVSVVYHDKHDIKREAMVTKSVNLLYSDNYDHCSHAVCHADEDKNEEEVSEWVRSWKAFPEDGPFWRKCYYNPNNLEEVLSEVSYTKANVIHGLFWPLFGILCISIIVTVFAVTFRCGDEPVSRRRSHRAAEPAVVYGAQRDGSVAYVGQGWGGAPGAEVFPPGGIEASAAGVSFDPLPEKTDLSGGGIGGSTLTFGGTPVYGAAGGGEALSRDVSSAVPNVDTAVSQEPGAAVRCEAGSSGLPDATTDTQPCLNADVTADTAECSSNSCKGDNMCITDFNGTQSSAVLDSLNITNCESKEMRAVDVGCDNPGFTVKSDQV